ncbi:hypothetical protein CUC50_01985 [Citrobacter werkmanii]|nr:hypothetical protein CUC50_01985 [Citrobacter werkmanii]
MILLSYLTIASMMPASAALAIIQAQLCNECNKIAIHFILQAASLLAALRNPSHIVIYAPGDFFPCRLDAS